MKYSINKYFYLYGQQFFSGENQIENELLWTAVGVYINNMATAHRGKKSKKQSWAISVFLNVFNNKNYFLHFLSNYFDWE